MSNKRQRFRGIQEGYRSGLEESTAANLKERGVSFTYEEEKIKWTDLKIRTYTPDFVLENGIIIETKGRFVSTAVNIRRSRSNTLTLTYGSCSTTHELNYTREPKAHMEIGAISMASSTQIRSFLRNGWMKGKTNV